MIQAALLSSLCVDQLDRNGHEVVSLHDEATGLGWFMVLQAEPGGPVTGTIIRLDPGTMGRTLFHFRSTPQDGRQVITQGGQPFTGSGGGLDGDVWGLAVGARA